VSGGKKLSTVRTISELRATVKCWRDAGRSVALVPTMGALHDGHLALVRRGLAGCDRAIVSIFVNPRQFGSTDDLARYPRRDAEDRQKLAVAGAHLVFLPSVAEMYPDGFATTVSVTGPLTQVLDAVYRPGHFEGVATVVAKLLLQAMPDVAVFGEKDFQQLQVVRRLVRDLDIPVRIEAVPTLRDADGLALSSRNFNLSRDERRIAAVLPAVLFAAADSIARGHPVDPVLAAARRDIGNAGFPDIDYLELADAETLSPVRVIGPDVARLFAAAWVGRTRLIDNVPIAPNPNP
jgi:pantoate--beta-alanine ligase